jgi:hypothetical protein
MIASVNNNFYLDITNSGLTNSQVNLFGLGQVGFDFATYNCSSSTYDFSNFVSPAGLCLYTTTLLAVEDNFTNFIAVTAPAGTPFADLAAPLQAQILLTHPNSDPHVFIQQVNGSIFNITVYTLPNVYMVDARVGASSFPSETINFDNTTVTGNSSNPNITISSQLSYLDLRQSLNGTVYSLVCFDLNSQNELQLTQPITFRRKNAFGDREISSITPVIDPYANNSATIGKVDLFNFLLDEECSVYFNMYAAQVSKNQIVPNTIRLYFYYAKWTVENFKNFEIAYRFDFLQEIYNLEKLMTEQRYKSVLLS